MPDYPAVTALADCYLQRELQLEVLPVKAELAEFSLREICLNRPTDDVSKPITMVVFDEYGDAEIDNPIVWLHLVVTSCEAIEESANYAAWLKDEGYPDTDFFKSLYSDTAALVPKIRQMTGSEVSAISHIEIELNTGIAQALRDYKFSKNSSNATKT